jgi:hypothetical protein
MTHIFEGVFGVVAAACVIIGQFGVSHLVGRLPIVHVSDFDKRIQMYAMSSSKCSLHVVNVLASPTCTSAEVDIKDTDLVSNRSAKRHAGTHYVSGQNDAVRADNSSYSSPWDDFISRWVNHVPC